MSTIRILTLCVVTSTAIITTSAFGQSPQQMNAQPTIGDRVDVVVSKVTGDPLAHADTDMKHVLDALTALHPKAIETLTPVEARQQPSPADAVKMVLENQGKSLAPDSTVTTKDLMIDGGAGQIAARIYMPSDVGGGDLPIVVYYHGGGFVIATINTYDAGPRALAKDTKAIVVSVEYRKAPEAKFPAQGEDAVAAYKWVLQNAKSLGGDPSNVAVMGESAGGNLAINVAIAARDQKFQPPVYQVLVYPVAGVSLATPSYIENAGAKPLNKAMMEWFFNNTVRNPADLQDARIDIVGKADVRNLPPATVITAEIDPLRSEGQALAEKLSKAGVIVDAKTFDGVTHEFYGMGVVVGKAKDAEELAAKDLVAAFKMKSGAL